MKKRTYRPFKQARKYVRKLNLKTQNEWWLYFKSGKIPDDITSRPHRIYKDKGWISWGDFLGTGRIANQNRTYRPFKQARKYVQSLKLKDTNEWKSFYKSKKHPIDIPSQPHMSYKKEWKGIGDWLGTGNLSSIAKSKQYLPFKQARKYVHSLKLKTFEDWRKFYKSKKRPIDIPSAPNTTYKKDWKGYGDWLGTGRVANQNKKFRTFKQARKFVHSLRLKSLSDWKKFCNSSKLPADIPKEPSYVYKDKGWESYGDWLGTGTLSPKEQAKLWLPIKEAKVEARKIVKKLGIKKREDWYLAYQKGLIPKNLPRDLANLYNPKVKESKRMKK